jgi:hypothetical protein
MSRQFNNTTVKVQIHDQTYDLTYCQAKVIEYIKSHEGRVRTKQAYAWYPGGCKSITPVIARLRDLGLVETWADPTRRKFEYRIVQRLTPPPVSYHDPFGIGARQQANDLARVGEVGLWGA